jgi:hypothetical protein
MPQEQTERKNEPTIEIELLNKLDPGKVYATLGP